MRLAIFLLAAGFHGFLLFFTVFNMKTRVILPETGPKVMKLLDISELSLPEEPPAVPPPVAPPQPKKPPVIPQQTTEPIAAIMVETEEIAETPELSVPESGLQQGASVNRASGDAEAAEGAQNAALTTAYIQKNFNYIQRRIRDKLLYPPQAKRTGVQGNAELLFTIHADGTVSDIRVRVSSGHELLDKAAIDAIYAAAPFRPPPVRARIAVPITFKLR
ncbi:MAG: TonB family protein [Treponema sp.]|jgi:protein TonB|nr:TonB family protein [Treponema sp.]